MYNDKQLPLCKDKKNGCDFGKFIDLLDSNSLEGDLTKLAPKFCTNDVKIIESSNLLLKLLFVVNIVLIIYFGTKVNKLHSSLSDD